MYLEANDGHEVHLSGLIHNLLELPSSDIAEPNIVDLACLDQVIQDTQCLLYWCPIIPAMSLQDDGYNTAASASP